jgi:small subunit ribosomal protein S9
MMEPLTIAGDAIKKVDIEVNVQGGGVMGQADASRTAIAKAIVIYTEDVELKKKYIAYDRSLLVSDPRRKLPKKPLGRGARVKRQKSYR